MEPFNANNALDFTHTHLREYVEANGLGGFASGTFSGAHSRRYHGLLVAATEPSAERKMVVSKMEETICINDEFLPLGCNQFPGCLYPFGIQYLSSFSRNLFPEWTYEVRGIKIRKTIAAVHGENTTLVLYEVVDAPGKFTMDLRAFYSSRNVHSLSHRNDQIGRPYIFEKGVFRTMNYQGCPEFFISVPRAVFTEDQTWYNDFEYLRDFERGSDFREDLYTHGKFSVQLRKHARVGVILSLQDPVARDAFKLFREERRRRESLVRNLAEQSMLRRLILAADQFVVKRDETNAIISGYPWLSELGRDTMISLTGLCLVTGRLKHAKKVIQKYSENIRDGLIPNRFPDNAVAREYNSIDSTLWFFHAVYKYYQYTSDKLFVRTLLPILRDIVDVHYRGTMHNIHVDPADELLTGGTDGVQLTWMDAKVGDWAVTPRKGKTVEVNALWYNALRTMEFFMREFNYHGDADFYHLKARMVYENFNRLFWNAADHCLYDYIDGNFASRDIRPNQLYAIGLTFKVLDDQYYFSVLQVVRKHLLTPRGLRTLSPAHSDYRGRCEGDETQRNTAYHQGAVWSYLTGIYVDALYAILGEDAREEARMLINGFAKHLDEAGLGSISEIFDADAPHIPRGCFAHAPGVAELLRVALEYHIFEPKKREAQHTFSVEVTS